MHYNAPNWSFRVLFEIRTNFSAPSTLVLGLELRPINVRLAGRTRGHAFVVMLAYRLRLELARRWRDLDVTVAEGIAELASVCTIDIHVKDVARSHSIPTPRDLADRLLRAAEVRLPKALPNRGVIVTTKKKLPARRVRH